MKQIFFLATLSLLGFMLSAQTAITTYNQTGVLDATYYTSGSFTERITYFENGEIKEIASFVNLKPEGEWLTFNEVGEIIQRGKYENGRKTGEWFVSCEISKQLFKLTYESDERIAATEFTRTD